MKSFLFICNLSNIHDFFTDADMTTRVVKSLTQTFPHEVKATAVSLIKLSNKMSDIDIKSTLSNIDTKSVGRNFLALVSYNLISTLMDCAADQGLVDIKSQWMYIISDTDERHQELTQFDRLLSLGQNIAFVYNTTRDDKTCNVSLLTHEYVIQLYKEVHRKLIVYMFAY